MSSRSQVKLSAALAREIVQPNRRIDADRVAADYAGCSAAR